MKNNREPYPLHDGYRESIRRGMEGVRHVRSLVPASPEEREETIRRIRQEIDSADAVVIGAGAGLSTSAGMTYSGPRFRKYFSDFADAFYITDMYSGGFYPFPDDETFWAWWSRMIYYNRYVDAPGSAYRDLLELVRDRDWFVITTNVDHQFQRAGFERDRLFYTQGDYGLFQTAGSGGGKTWDNEADIVAMMEAQGFERDEQGIFTIPEGKTLSMRIPSSLIPRDPDTGGAVQMNLRSDDSFVEDEGWRRASARYADFLQRHEGLHVLFLEIGVGNNTPVIIKYPFWQMTADNDRAVYACISHSSAGCPRQIRDRSLCVNGDAGEVIRALL